MKDIFDKKLQGARAVVIGGGVAGLSAAISLAAHGARVRVLERESELGGRLRTVKLGDYTFEPGEKTLTHPQYLGRLFVQADLRLSDFLEFTPVDPAATLMLPDGRSVEVHRDADRLADEIARHAPGDADRLRALLRRWESTGRRIEERFLAVPDDGGDITRDPGSWPALGAACVPLSLARRIRRHFKSPAAAAVFEYFAGRLGATLYRAPAGLAPTLALQHARGVWAAKGGNAAVIDALQRVCELKEIGIITGARVDRIELENNAVRRVSGQGFKAFRADLVVSTIDPATVVGQMIAAPKSAALPKRIERLAPSRSGLVFLLGCTRGWESFGRLETVLMSDDLLETSRQIDRWNVSAARPSIHVFNETVTRPDAAPGGHSALKIFVSAPLLTNRYRWSPNNVAAERDRLFARLRSAGLDSFEKAIAEESVITPADWAGRYHLRQGALYGGSLNTPRGWLNHAPQRCPGIGGLFFAGDWSHPGPGTAYGLLSGMLAAEAAAE